MKKMAKVHVLILIAFLCAGVNRADQGPKENQIKALFLFNFTQFVKWPAGTFKNEASPFVIGVVGKNIFGSRLEEICKGEKFDGRDILVKYYERLPENVSDCQILFIEKSFPQLKESIVDTRAKAILTVSDGEHFMEHSGILRFYLEESKMRLEINQDIAVESGLEISSKLLRLATIYKKKKKDL